MRFNRYLREEDIIKKALSISEPEVGMKYTKDEVASNISIIKDALDSLSEKDVDIKRDLLDKLDKWKNWKEEVKSEGPNPIPMLPGEVGYE